MKYKKSDIIKDKRTNDCYIITKIPSKKRITTIENANICGKYYELILLKKKYPVVIRMQTDVESSNFEFKFNKDLIPPDYQEDFIVYAFKHMLGHESYVAFNTQAIIKHAWSRLTKKTQLFIKKEIKTAEHTNNLGLAPDAEQWLKLLDLDG